MSGELRESLFSGDLELTDFLVSAKKAAVESLMPRAACAAVPAPLIPLVASVQIQAHNCQSRFSLSFLAKNGLTGRVTTEEAVLSIEQSNASVFRLRTREFARGTKPRWGKSKKGGEGKEGGGKRERRKGLPFRGQ